MGIYRDRNAEIWTVKAAITQPMQELAIRGNQSASAFEVNLLLDAGSARCGLTSAAVRQLSLTSWHSWTMETVTGRSVVSVYDVAVRFPDSNLRPFPRLAVAEIQLPSRLAGFDGVLGRDVLSKWELLYRGPRGTLTIRDHASFVGWLAS